MEALQRRGAVEISPLEYEGEVFAKEETSQQQALFTKSSATSSKAYEIMCRYFPEKSSMLDMFKGRDQLSADEYYKNVERTKEIMRDAASVIALDKSMSEKKADIANAVQGNGLDGGVYRDSAGAAHI